VYFNYVDYEHMYMRTLVLRINLIHCEVYIWMNVIIIVLLRYLKTQYVEQANPMNLCSSLRDI